MDRFVNFLTDQEAHPLQMPKLAGSLSQLAVRSRAGEVILNIVGTQITKDFVD